MKNKDVKLMAFGALALLLIGAYTMGWFNSEPEPVADTAEPAPGPFDAILAQLGIIPGAENLTENRLFTDEICYIYNVDASSIQSVCSFGLPSQKQVSGDSSYKVLSQGTTYTVKFYDAVDSLIGSGQVSGPTSIIVDPAIVAHFDFVDTDGTVICSEPVQ